MTTPTPVRYAGQMVSSRQPLQGARAGAGLAAAAPRLNAAAPASAGARPHVGQSHGVGEGQQPGRGHLGRALASAPKSSSSAPVAQPGVGRFGQAVRQRLHLGVQGAAGVGGPAVGVQEAPRRPARRWPRPTPRRSSPGCRAAPRPGSPWSRRQQMRLDAAQAAADQRGHVPVAPVLAQGGRPPARPRPARRCPSAGAIRGQSTRLAPASIRPAPSALATARRSSGSAATSAERESVPHTSLSASAAAMARTRHSVSGATTSQQPGTALATMAGVEVEEGGGHRTGADPARAGPPGRRSSPDQKPRQAGVDAARHGSPARSR